MKKRTRKSSKAGPVNYKGIVAVLAFALVLIWLARGYQINHSANLNKTPTAAASPVDQPTRTGVLSGYKDAIDKAKEVSKKNSDSLSRTDRKELDKLLDTVGK